MVDEKTSTRALTGSRRMSQSLPALIVDYDPEGVPDQWQSPGPGSKPWIPIPSAFSAWYIENYFDTSGYTRDQLTTVPRSIYTQHAGRLGMATPGNIRVVVFDFVLTERLDDIDAFFNEFVNSNATIPSFPTSKDDWSQVLYGRFRQYTGITQGTAVQDIFAPVNDDSFGSLEATTADKLWTYKIVMILGIPAATFLTTFRFPASRIVADIDVVKEDELEFMMRQKRSYELTNY